MDVQLPDGTIIRNVPDGTTREQLAAKLASKGYDVSKLAAPASKPFGAALEEGLRDVPRQLGLTARYAAEGAGGMLDMLSSPIRAGLNALPGVNIKPGSGEALSNMLGLPQPRDAGERMVGDAARFVAGGALPIAAGARLAAGAPGIAQRVGQQLAAGPGTQLASAGTAGLAGGYTRETGGGELAQTAAQLAAGIGTPFAVQAAQRGGRAAANVLGSGRQVPPMQVDLAIETALSGGQGGGLSSLPADAAAALRKDVADALKISPDLSPDAIRRLADYRLTGLTPNRAGLTLSPTDVTRQRNLAKQSANSKDPQAQGLANMENANNDLLTQGLNKLGANTTDDRIAGAGRIMGALEQRNARAKSLIDQRYQDARTTSGRSAQLDPEAFAARANSLLDEALLGGKLPADVRNMLNRKWTEVVSDGQPAGSGPAATPPGLTVDIAEQLKTRIGDLQRSSSDAAERKALGLVRSALDDTPLMPGQDIGQTSIDAFNRARALNRGWMGIVEKTPALQAIRDGVEPDKFVKDFIIGSGKNANVMDVAQLKNSIKKSPDALAAVKEQIAAYLKGQGKSGAADEIVNFSQSGYNKALSSIGDRKLALFFPPEELAQLKALGRVASYEQIQPKGAAVNNSNTAAALLDRLMPALEKIPFGRQAISDPLQNIMLSQQVRGTLSAPRALVAGPGQAPQPTIPRALPSPAILQQQPDQLAEDERKRRIAQMLGYAQ